MVSLLTLLPCALKFAGNDFVMLKRRAGLQAVGKGARERREKEEAG